MFEKRQINKVHKLRSSSLINDRIDLLRLTYHSTIYFYLKLQVNAFQDEDSTKTALKNLISYVKFCLF